jgi:xanthine dehydrogenase accessory factor
MKKQIAIWMLIEQSIRNDIAVMLLYVLESKGSSPGRQGFFMAVNAKEEMEGSIGGGIMEHKFVELAKEQLPTSTRQLQTSIKKQIHDKSATKDQSGMICSGEQTILLYRVKKEELPAIEKIIAILQQQKNATLFLSPEGISYSEESPAENFSFSMWSEKDWLYKEKIGYKNQLSIIGGGHCSLAFSKIMSEMDFYIRLYDERKNLKTMLENEYVQEKFEIENYGQLKELIAGGKNHYVVIMTFGYRTDDIALRALLGKEFRYLGMLGSRKKIEKLFDDLRSENISEDIIQKIYSPIGINIKSETPEEIAISIAAEIIRVKNMN